MNLTEIVSQAILISDEDMPTSEVFQFLNDAVAKINVECKANFPFFNLNTADEEYAGFDETWQRTLLVPFAVGRIKQKESSQFEYSDAYAEFSGSLLEFKASYTIPDEYKSGNTKPVVVEDFSTNLWGW